MPRVDLDAYFARIGYRGPREPSFDVLAALQGLHIAAIPFEAIDVLLGRGIRLDPAVVDDKLIRRERGGYCFEQNGLFLRVLKELGFEAEGRLARVLWGVRPGSRPQTRTHMALCVQADGASWLVDVGFGTAVPTAPLRWDVEEAQATPHGRFRLSMSRFGLLVETDLAGPWSPAYQVALEPPFDVDYEMANWFTSTHPASSFRHTLIVTHATPQRRAALLDGQLTIRPRDGEVQRKMLDPSGLEAALRDIFALPVQPEWRPILEAAARTSSPPK